MELAGNIVGSSPGHVGKHAGAVDEDVRVPDRRHAVVGIGADVDPELAVGAGVVDRLHTL